MCRSESTHHLHAKSLTSAKYVANINTLSVVLSTTNCEFVWPLVEVSGILRDMTLEIKLTFLAVLCTRNYATFIILLILKILGTSAKNAVKPIIPKADESYN